MAFWRKALQNRLMQLRFLFSLTLLALGACASAPKDFSHASPETGKARIYFYRPHAWQVMWGQYEISVGGKAVKILTDEGYFFLDLPPGKAEIRSKYVSDQQIVGLDLELKANQSYYVKLDPEPKEFTFLGAAGDILAISNMISGELAKMNIKSGQGNLSDVKNLVRGDMAKEGLKSKRAFGHHVLLSIQEGAAQKEPVSIHIP